MLPCVFFPNVVLQCDIILLRYFTLGYITLGYFTQCNITMGNISKWSSKLGFSTKGNPIVGNFKQGIPKLDYLSLGNLTLGNNTHGNLILDNHSLCNLSYLGVFSTEGILTLYSCTPVHRTMYNEKYPGYNCFLQLTFDPMFVYYFNI